MATETILQSELATNFIYPFLLVFIILFAVLEKTKVLGGDKKQLNAILSFIVALIFVGFAWPKMVIGNLILFLSVSLVIIFLILLVWGFAAGGAKGMPSLDGIFRIVLGIIAVIAIIIAVFWATGSLGPTADLLFSQSWSGALWTNIIFIVVVAAVIAFAVKSTK